MGKIVGKTFGCIIATQFERLRKCDRFWYESPDKDIGFTEKQIKSIKKFTMASLICNNLDEPGLMQEWAFDLSHGQINPRFNCSSHFKLDLWHWKEEKEGRSGRSDKIDFCDTRG